MTLDPDSFLAPAPPETPKGSGGNKHGASIATPFSFGLGFSPSFSFNSPRAMGHLGGMSPHRFLQTSSSLNHVIEAGRPKNKHDNREPKLLESLHLNNHSDQHQSQGTNGDNGDNGDSGDSDLSKSSVMWSLENNQTISTIYENEQMTSFLTPSKLFLGNKPGSATNLSPHSLENTSTPKRPQGHSRSSSTEESPNKFAASKIDSAIVSPAQRKQAPVFTHPDSLGDKVWNTELDEVLIRSYIKYSQFLGNNTKSPSTLKNTSQNKVLSRMVYNRTGVNRSAKQISSRLFRLSKLKKLIKMKSKAEEERSRSFNEESQLSFDDDSSDKTNSLLDKELEILLSSPILKEELKNCSSSNDCKLVPTDYVLAYVNKNDSASRHNFTTMGGHSYEVMHPLSLKIKLTGIISTNMIRDTVANIANHKVPLILVDNLINLSVPQQPFLESPGAFDVNKGDFEAYLQFQVKLTHNAPPMLNWKCTTQIFCNNVKLENTSVVTGFPERDSYNFKIPFFKQFWAGYLTFLNDGSNLQGLSNLSVLQILHGDDQHNSSIHGYIVHTFKEHKAPGPATSKFTTISLIDNDEQEDDNATVIASSSPDRFSPHDEKWLSGARLSRPIYRANIVSQSNLEMLKKHEEEQSERPRKRLSSHSLNEIASRLKRPSISSGPSPQGSSSDPESATVANSGPLSAPLSGPVMSNIPVPGISIQPAEQASVPHQVPQVPQVPHVHQQIPHIAPGPHDVNVPIAPTNMATSSSRRPVTHYVSMEPNLNYMPRYTSRLETQGLYSAPASQTAFFPKKETNKENTKPKEIKFGPILEYDPSKDANRPNPKQQKPSNGLHSFPVNTQVMYKPKK